MGSVISTEVEKSLIFFMNRPVSDNVERFLDSARNDKPSCEASRALI
jgi:hypothetical protein